MKGLALIPYDTCKLIPGYAKACGLVPPGAYGVFFDQEDKSLHQELAKGLDPVRVRGYQAVMGLTNPDSEDYGYRACVTGDYDLFGVWAPARAQHDRFFAMHGNRVDVRAVEGYEQNNPRDLHPEFQQHYRLGNISPRINNIKVLLNGALIVAGAYSGGNLVHHSDEIGNPSKGLKKSLAESFPLIAFMPRSRWPANRQLRGLCALNTIHFAELLRLCLEAGIDPVLRPGWNYLMPHRPPPRPPRL